MAKTLALPELKRMTAPSLRAIDEIHVVYSTIDEPLAVLVPIEMFLEIQVLLGGLRKMADVIAPRER